MRAQRQEKTHSVASIGGRQLHDRYMDNTNVEVRKKQSVLMYQKRNVLNNSESILFTLYLFERRKSLYALYDIDGFFLFARSGAHLLVAALMTPPPLLSTLSNFLYHSYPQYLPFRNISMLSKSYGQTLPAPSETTTFKRSAQPLQIRSDRS